MKNTKSSRNKPENLVGSEAMVLWNKVITGAEESIKELEDELVVKRAILALARKKFDSEKRKFDARTSTKRTRSARGEDAKLEAS